MRKIALILIVLFLPFATHATTCNIGYYLDENDQCVLCRADGYYCPGDNSMNKCPSAESFFESAAAAEPNLIRIEKFMHSWAPENGIADCRARPKLYTTIGQYFYSNVYNPNMGTYPFNNSLTKYWESANTGYYLYNYFAADSSYYNIAACTNAPSNAHYTGAGTPDVGDCPWECDAGYWNDNGVCTQCPAGYYIDNGQCIVCLRDHYCVGDGTIQICPAITYTQSDLQQMVRNAGYTVISGGSARLWSGWQWSEAAMTDIEHCVMTIMDMQVTQGTIYVLSAQYSNSIGNYVIPAGRKPYWKNANTGYYLSNTTNNSFWSNIKQCTNPYPQYAHYSGPGTPDSADGTIVDANDCPWECDAGYGQHGNSCLPLCTAGITEFHVGNNLVFNVWRDKITTPSLHAMRNNTVCYINLEPGIGRFNIQNGANVYHVAD